MRNIVAGVIGGAAWFFGLRLVFGPAQSILADPDRQSAKMLAAFSLATPAPRMYGTPWLVPLALVTICIAWAFVYRATSGRWSVPWWKRGLAFAAIAWTLMVPWFEFYLPFNVLREPMPLVLLEMACWAGVMGLVGLAIAGTDAFLSHYMKPR